jgi:DNA-binding transcriptional regulator YbjK
MSVEDVIAASIESARDEGLIDGQSGDEPVDIGTEGGDSATGEGEAEVVAKAEDTDDPPVGEGEGTDEEKAAKAALAAIPKLKKDKDGVEPDLMTELGLKPRADGREHRIPLTRVKGMVQAARTERDTAVKTIVETVGKAIGLPDTELATATPETVMPRLNGILQEASGLYEKTRTMDDLAPVMLSDGDKFIRMLAGSNPQQYGKFLAVLEEGFTPKTGALPDEANDPMPEPDLPITMADGTKGRVYSQAQDQKRLEWLERKSERKFNAALEARFKPYEDRDKTVRARAAQQHQVITQLDEFLGEAHEWKGFTENKDAILAETKKIDTSVPFRKAVRQAYEKLVFGKLHTDRTKLREEFMEELKKAPSATGVAKKGGAPKKDDEGAVRGEGGEMVTGTEAAIRRSIAKAKAAGVIK